MHEEASRAQEEMLKAKVAELQDSITSNTSKIMYSLDQNQCLVGGLQMQIMNMAPQVQALLIGQSQLQAQMIAQQAASISPAEFTESRKNTKDEPVTAEEKPKLDVKAQTQPQGAQAEGKIPPKRKRPGSRTRRKARSAFHSSQSLPEPLEKIEDVLSEGEASSAGSGEVANLAEFENMFDNFACSKDAEAQEDNDKTNKNIDLTCLVSQYGKQLSSEFEADVSSCGGFSPQPSLRSSFCLEELDNPQECLTPPLNDALFVALSKLRNGQQDAAEECMKILEREDFNGINVKSQGGRTALHVAVRCQHEGICRAILARPDFTEINAKYRGHTALTLAAEKELTEVCLAILEREDFSEINAKTIGCGETALHKAAAKGLTDICRAIMNCKDFHSVNATTLPRSMGCTAAEVAEGCGHAEVADMIRSLGGR